MCLDFLDFDLYVLRIIKALTYEDRKKGMGWGTTTFCRCLTPFCIHLSWRSCKVTSLPRVVVRARFECSANMRVLGRAYRDGGGNTDCSTHYLFWLQISPDSFRFLDQLCLDFGSLPRELNTVRVELGVWEENALPNGFAFGLLFRLPCHFILSHTVFWLE